MATKSLLFKHSISVVDGIDLYIPTVGEILENESEYYSQVSMLTSMPIDLCVALDDVGVDFTTINDYELFLMLFPVLQSQDTHLIFADMDMSKFVLAADEQSQTAVYINPDTGVVIDRKAQAAIARALRDLHGLKKNNRKPANDTAKQYMIEKERKRLKRLQREPQESHLEKMIVALVNTEQFPYKFDEVPGMTIYQFNESLRQIVHKIEFDNRMHGVYAGTVSAKDMSQDDLNWLEHK